MHNQFSAHGLPLKRIFIVIGSLLLLVAAGVAVFFALSAMNKGKDDEQKAQNETVLNDIGAGLKKTAKVQQNASVLIGTTFVAPMPLLKVSPSVWVRSDENTQALTYFVRQESAADTDADYAAAINYLSSRGLSETLNDTATSSRYYASALLSCAVKKSSETLDGKTQYSLSIGCARVSDFAKQKESVAKIAEAYDAKKVDNLGPLAVQMVLVQPAVKKDYANANVSLSKISEPSKVRIGKFYQVPGGQWNFLTIVDDQDKAPCSLFTSDEQLSAFQGTPCWDTSANASSFVQFPNSIHSVEDNAGN